jgi:hypothetical protein
MYDRRELKGIVLYGERESWTVIVGTVQFHGNISIYTGGNANPLAE